MLIRSFVDTDLPAILKIYAEAKSDELQLEGSNFRWVPLDQDQRRYTQFRQADVYVCQEADDKDELIGYCAHDGSLIRALYVHRQ